MAQTRNMHVASLVRASRVYKKEGCLSASADVPFLMEADYLRQSSYLDDLDSDIDRYQVKPLLDLPESHGFKLIELGEPLGHVDKENQGINLMCSLYDEFESLLVNSASSRLSSGILSPDYKRGKAVLGALRSELEDLKSKLPLDLPETVPSKASAGPGARGIEPK